MEMNGDIDAKEISSWAKAQTPEYTQKLAIGMQPCTMNETVLLIVINLFVPRWDGAGRGVASPILELKATKVRRWICGHTIRDLWVGNSWEVRRLHPQALKLHIHAGDDKEQMQPQQIVGESWLTLEIYCIDMLFLRRYHEISRKQVIIKSLGSSM